MLNPFDVLGLDPATSTPDELAKLVRDDAVKWARVIKANHIQAQ